MNTLPPDSPNLSPTLLTFTPDIAADLRETAKWSKFFGVMSFIAAALTILIGIFVFIADLDPFSSEMPELGPDQSGFDGLLLFGAFIYIIGGLIYIYVGRLFFGFSTQIKQAFDHNDQVALGDAMGQLKQLYRFFGILTIIVLVLYALIIIGGLLFIGVYSDFGV